MHDPKNTQCGFSKGLRHECVCPKLPRASDKFIVSRDRDRDLRIVHVEDGFPDVTVARNVIDESTANLLAASDELCALLEECLANSLNQGSPWRKRAMAAVLKARGRS